MATKRFIIEVEEGDTSCRECPIIAECDEPGMCGCTRLVNCCDYNLATMKVNTEEVTKEKILKEVINWIEERYDTNYVGGDIVRMLKNRLMEEEKCEK